MTKKRIVVIISIVAAALIVAVAALYTIRNINEKPPIVVEQNLNTTTRNDSTPETPVIVTSAPFKGVDTIHWARGTVEILEVKDEARLSFRDDFEVAQGPDLFVYLSPNEAGQELGEFASLGNLKSSKSLQEYNLPENYKDYKTVVIWCRAFGVTFATADLR